jgi:hypothetical protein
VGINPPTDDVSDTIKTHRALDDIKMHLAEAKWHMDFWRKAKKSNLRGLDSTAFEDVSDAEAAVEATIALWKGHVAATGVEDSPEELAHWLLAQMPASILPPEKV